MIPMPKIESISVCAARVPLDRVTSFSSRTVHARDYGLVKVAADDGTEGIGFCYVGSGGGEILPVVVEHLLGRVLLGRDTLNVEGLWQELYQESLLHGRAGTVLRAISMLDTALWDVNARACKLPLHKYLGAVHLDTVPAYASGGYYVDGKSPEDLGREMAGYVSQGFAAVKIKTGRLSPAEEEARLSAAREAVGPDIELMMDVNNGWQDLTQALQYVRRFEKYDPYFIEEPFTVDDIDNHARLAKATHIPIATGEIEAMRWRHKELLEKGGASILQTDALVCGGISEWRRIAAMASGFGVVMCPHWFHDLHAPLVAATSNARYVEFFTDDQVLNFRKLINRQLRFERGRIVLHQTPGLGFEFDEEAVAQYAIPAANASPWSVIRR
jgi:L-alanine-DL-glutamate epimerase-like enolase superfamily enzyme